MGWHASILAAAPAGVLPIKCQNMPNIRHTPQAPTRTQVLAAGERIDAHHHDDHQIIYAGSGVLAITTGHAAPSSCARSQFRAVTHQRSPGVRPGNR